MKNLPLQLLLLVSFYTVLRYLTQVAVVLKGKGSGGEFLSSGSRSECILALLKGMRDALLTTPAMLRMRAIIMGGRRVRLNHLMHLLKRYRISFGSLLDNAEGVKGPHLPRTQPFQPIPITPPRCISPASLAASFWTQ